MPLIPETGAERDAFSRRSRRLLRWNHSARAKIKRAFRRRVRRAFKRETCELCNG